MIKTSSRLRTKKELEQSNAPSYNFNPSLQLNSSFDSFKDKNKVILFVQVLLPDLYYTRTAQDHQELMTDWKKTSILCGRTQLQHILRGIRCYWRATLSYMRNMRDKLISSKCIESAKHYRTTQLSLPTC